MSFFEPRALPAMRVGSTVALIAATIASLASAAIGASAPTAGDSLLGPLEARHRARVAEVGAMGKKVGAADLNTMIGAGRVDEAAAALPRASVSTEVGNRLKLRIALARQDFETAKPLAQAILKRSNASESDRALGYAWLFEVDDAAEVDRRTRAVLLAPGASASTADLIAAGRLAYDLLDYARADSCFTRALENASAVAASSGKRPASATDSAFSIAARSAALRGQGLVLYKRRDYDGSLQKLSAAVNLAPTAENLLALCETLIRLGRTDDAIRSAELAVRTSPYHDGSHYMLGNGYARKNYTELTAAYPAAFADAAGRAGLDRADALLADGKRAEARKSYDAVQQAQPGWADVHVRLASLDFEEGAFDAARDHCFAALKICPEYGRAHATLAKALESRRFTVDVHRPDYEKRFAAASMPDVPGIDRFVINWKSLSPRHQKRVALSVAPWKQYIPVLVEGGSTYYIKPLYMLLSETPGLETLRDTRIDYDSRLWDDVRGAGGFNTVTGVEDVERTIFDRYNTVLHELTHQVHGVLTLDQSREIQEHYRQAKERDDQTKNAYLSRYAGGSVWEYFAEGANALYSPKRDAYDPREVVRERLDVMDPALKTLVEKRIAHTDVSASYPVAYTNAGNDRVEKGDVKAALGFYDKALARNAREESALQALTYARSLAADRPGAVAAARRALAEHPSSGGVVATAAEAYWHGGMGLDSALALVERARSTVRPEDRYQVDLERGRLLWSKGDPKRAMAAYDSVLEYQSDNPEALWGAASSLGLQQRWKPAFEFYDRAVRVRTGIVELRCDYARDLLRAGRLKDALNQLEEARLLDPEHPTAEALRGWAFLEGGDADSARAYATRALEWGPWSDLARIVLAKAEAKRGDRKAADAALASVRERIAKNAPPEYTYRKKLSRWISIHELPAIEREFMSDDKRAGSAGGR